MRYLYERLLSYQKKLLFTEEPLSDYTRSLYNQDITPIIFDVTGQDTYAKFVDPNTVPSGILPILLQIK